MVTSGEATQEGVQSMLNLIDPFPDEPLKLSGWPDSRSEPTVVSKVVAEMSVSAPGTVPWDFHIAFQPSIGTNDSIGGTAQYHQASPTNSGYSIDAAVGPSQGQFFLSIAKSSTGGDLNPLTQGKPLDDSNNSLQTWLTTQQKRIWRPVAIGIEAVNTSAQLYRGGMSYAYRLPNDMMDGALIKNALPTGVGLSSSRIGTRPPTSPTQIIGYANTYVGDASAGVGWVGAPRTFDNDFVRPMPCFNGVTNDGTYVWGQTYDHPMFNWDVGGVFVTGQPVEATWVVKFIMVYEFHPTTDDQIFLNLAVPSVPYSPMLEQMVIGVLKDLPAGFDYRDNPFGEWFARVVDSVIEHAPKVLSVIKSINPVAGAIGKGVIAAASAVRTAQKKKAAAKYAASLPPPKTR